MTLNAIPTVFLLTSKEIYSSIAPLPPDILFEESFVPLTTTPAPVSVLLVVRLMMVLPDNRELFLITGSGHADLSLHTLLQHLRLSAHSETTYYPRQSMLFEFTQLLFG